MRAPTVLYVRRSDVHADPPTDDAFRVVLAMDAEEYQGQLQARVRELEERDAKQIELLRLSRLYVSNPQLRESIAAALVSANEETDDVAASEGSG